MPFLTHTTEPQGVGNANVFGSHFRVHMVHGILSDMKIPHPQGMQQILFDQPRGLEREQSATGGKKEGGETQRKHRLFLCRRERKNLKKKLMHKGKEIITQFR